MGALKHIVLPLCTVAHLFAIGVFIVQGKEYMADMLEWPRNTVRLTPIERHLLGAGFAFHVVLTMNNIAAIMVENAHYRAMATFLELVLYSLDLADAMYENTFLGDGVALFTLVPLATTSLTKSESSGAAPVDGKRYSINYVQYLSEEAMRWFTASITDREFILELITISTTSSTV